MAWFRRERPAFAPAPASVSAPASAAAPTGPVGDSPTELLVAVRTLNRFVNSSAGRLPVHAVVAARRITDLVAEILAVAETRPLDIQTRLLLRGIIGDYLPTTLRSYLAVDPALVDVARRGVGTPRHGLLEQLAALEGSAHTMLIAVKAQDVDALTTQGNFLRVKFTGSDLTI